MNTTIKSVLSSTPLTVDTHTVDTVPTLDTPVRTQVPPVPAAISPLAGWIAEAHQAEAKRQVIEQREKERLEIARARFAAD